MVLIAAKIKGVAIPAVDDKFAKHRDWNLILNSFGLGEEYLFNPNDLPMTIVSKAGLQQEWNGAVIDDVRLPTVWPRKVFEDVKEGRSLILHLKNGKDIALDPCNQFYKQELPAESNAITKYANTHGIDTVDYTEIPFEVIVKAIKDKRPPTVRNLKQRRGGYGN